MSAPVVALLVSTIGASLTTWTVSVQATDDQRHAQAGGLRGAHECTRTKLGWSSDPEVWTCYPVSWMHGDEMSRGIVLH